MILNEQDDLRVVMRQWATGVTVVSTRYQDVIYGMTVSSFSSVSLKPKVVSISLMKDSRTHSMILQSKVFGISILSDDQREISEVFAGRISENENRFEGIETFILATGSPLITGGIGYLDCRLMAVHDFGRNSLLIGEVLALESGNSQEPLLYFNQHYHKLQE
jgi:flavin reductase (DIM6/NTAB) family NADH-FMN oxidoreductase RutF